MKNFVLAVIAVVGLAVTGGVMTAQQKSVLGGIVRCESRDTTSLPGYVICTWTKGGVPYRVDTNEIRVVTGKAQTNPVQARLAEVQGELSDIRARFEELKESHGAYTNRIESFRSFVKGRHDSTASWTAKAIYQAILDKLDGKEVK